jgi:hypothetical protein
MASSRVKEPFGPYFASLSDPRVARGRRHSLLDLVVLALGATLGGAVFD